jgi:hypothetical protein
MLRWVFLLRYPEGIAKDEGERWYLGTHTQEAKRLLGLRRYATWPAQKAAVAPPWTTVDRLNQWDRVTELGFDNWQAWQEATITNVPSYTPAPYGPRGFVAETIFISDSPDHNFLGNSPAPGGLSPNDEGRLVRWLFVLRYPEGISNEAGESWYLGTHTQEAKRMHGLQRYVSWLAERRPAGIAEQMRSKWDRLTELAFAGWDAWQEGAVTKMPRWTAPPYGNPGFLSETVFIGEQPEYDLLQEVPKLP